MYAFIVISFLGAPVSFSLGASNSLILREEEGGETLAFWAIECYAVVLFWNLLDFWNLLEFFWIFLNFLESFGIFWNHLKSFEIIWKHLESFGFLRIASSCKLMRAQILLRMHFRGTRAMLKLELLGASSECSFWVSGAP